MMHIPFVDLSAQNSLLRKEIDEAVSRVIDHGDFILGTEVQRFESQFAMYLGIKHALGVGNGLDALRFALIALNIEPGDEVLLPANTYIATALAISSVGARPVLVDIDEESFNIDTQKLEASVTSRTRALVVVHLFGQPADMDRVMSFAAKNKLRVIEDSCQSHGARYRGKFTGTFGDAGCFSFYPSKNLGAFGDAGAIVTAEDETAGKLQELRNYGQQKKYVHMSKGMNSRLDNIQAAILNVKLPHLNEWNRLRMAAAMKYEELLSPIPQVRIPRRLGDRDHIFHLYVIGAERRDELQTFLTERGIATQIHYPIPIHLQEAYRDLGYSRGSFPVTELLSQEILSLPMYPEIRSNQIQYIADAIVSFYSS